MATSSDAGAGELNHGRLDHLFRKPDGDTLFNRWNKAMRLETNRKKAQAATALCTIEASIHAELATLAETGYR